MKLGFFKLSVKDSLNISNLYLFIFLIFFFAAYLFFFFFFFIYVLYNVGFVLYQTHTSESAKYIRKSLEFLVMLSILSNEDVIIVTFFQIYWFTFLKLFLSLILPRHHQGSLHGLIHCTILADAIGIGLVL